MPRTREFVPTLYEMTLNAVVVFLKFGCLKSDTKLLQPVRGNRRSPNQLFREFAMYKAKVDRLIAAIPRPALEEALEIVSKLLASCPGNPPVRDLAFNFLDMVECSNPSEYTYGLCTLISCLPNMRIARLPFGDSFWAQFLKELRYASSAYWFVDRIFSDAIPRMGFLVSLNLAYVANDSIVYLLSKHCPLIEKLTLDYSLITDMSTRFLCGLENSAHSNRVEFSPNGPFQDGSQSARVSLPERFIPGCPKLLYLSVLSCPKITEKGVWSILEEKPGLWELRYRDIRSMGEILCRFIQTVPDEDEDEEAGSSSQSTSSGESYSETCPSQSKIPRLRNPGDVGGPGHEFPLALTSARRLMGKKPLPKFSLKVFEHARGSLEASGDHIAQVSKLCPKLERLNLTTFDEDIGDFVTMKNLRAANITFLDCFGSGLYRFLDNLGIRLVELSLSTVSDPDLTELEEGGELCQMFNAGLKLVGIFCPNLVELKISGYGVVSSLLMAELKYDMKSYANLAKNGIFDNSGSFRFLESLFLLGFNMEESDDLCEENLLFSVLRECRSLKTLFIGGNMEFMDDSFMKSLLAINPFRNLESLNLSSYFELELTKETARRLMVLPALKELRMKNWDLSGDEFEDLVEYARSNSWDIQMSMY